LYHLELTKPLKTINVPLAASDPDVVLDLQSSVAHVWRKGAFRKLVDYERTLPGLTPADMEWCRERLRQAGLGEPGETKE
jgi:hypothetical protein